MAHRRSFAPRGRGVSQSQRRKKTWQSVGVTGQQAVGIALTPPTPSVQGEGTVAVAGITSTDGAQFVEGTILRIRGSLDLPKSTPLSSLLGDANAFGIGFVTDEAFAASAVPNPADASGADWDGWLFYRSTPLDTVEANAGIVDSKSMRKWEDGMTLVLVAGYVDDSAVPVGTAAFTFIGRILILLP